MEELKSVRALSIRRLLVFLIPYGICILLSLVGVVLGAINFAAGPVHYSGFILVLWLLINILLFVAIFLHLTYYGIEIWRETDEYLNVVGYFLLVGLPVLGTGITLLTDKHYGWFSACALAALVICAVIDVVLVNS